LTIRMKGQPIHGEPVNLHRAVQPLVDELDQKAQPAKKNNWSNCSASQSGRAPIISSSAPSLRIQRDFAKKGAKPQNTQSPPND
jgi:hypothetical protein